MEAGQLTKNLLFGMIICIVTLALISSVHAANYEFTPNPVDLWELDHNDYICWGINWNIPAGERITEATLFIKGINNWANEANNKLYIHLLDNAPLGANRWADNEGNGDNWADTTKNNPHITGPLIAVYTDTNYLKSEDLAFKFSEKGLLDTLNSYLATPHGTGKGNFGIGFDPDCHYYNCGVKLKIDTAPVPEPGSILTLAAGLCSIAGSRLRRRLG
jgi:hypothetical protein